MNLTDVKRTREQFLLTLYEMAEGNADRECRTDELCSRLSINPDKEGLDIARYWLEEGMVGWGSYDRIFLKHKGRVRAEELIDANEQQNSARDNISVETMKCPDCGHDIRATARFCDSCGTSLDKFKATTLVDSDSAATTLAMGDSLIGQVLDGKYKVVERIGEGGIGTVYRAERSHIGDEVAIKVLHSKYVTDAPMLERFRTEARAAAKLQHPNIVRIHDFVEPQDANSPVFIVMELARGESLRSLLKREGRLDQMKAIALMREICAAVAAAHQARISHRDLKPDNIIVVPPHTDSNTESVKVVDFGIAKLHDVINERFVTEVGTLLGTPQYMSPEQCTGTASDARSDVYSLGVILYEMLSGSPPFTASSRAEIMAKHLREEPPALQRDLAIAPELEAVLIRALEKQPGDRQPDAAALSRELKEATEPQNKKAGQARPHLTESTLELRRRDVREQPVKLNDPEEIDKLVFKAACEKGMNARKLKHISVTELVKELDAFKISPDEVIDSLELLTSAGYIHPSDRKGCGLRICDFEITPHGFEQHAERYVPDYEAKRESVTLDIVRHHKDVFEKPDIITEHILDTLAADGSLQIAKYQGKIKVLHVSAQLRRKFKDGTPSDAHTVEAEAHSDSLATKAATLAEGIRYKQERESWLRSEKGREDARKEVAKLFDVLLRRAKEISDQGIEIQAATDGEECTLRWRGISLLASWNPGRFINNLEGTGLTMKLSTTSEPVYFVNEYVSEKVEIGSLRYDIDMAPKREIGWRETKGSKQVLPSDKIADIWVRYLIEEVESRLAE